MSCSRPSFCMATPCSLLALEAGQDSSMPAHHVQVTSRNVCYTWAMCSKHHLTYQELRSGTSWLVT